MRELPSGTVTLLFTDIEGSTRLLHELAERYTGVLAEHRRVLRAVFWRHGGVEVDTQGDAFFVAFSRASAAVVAAGEAQEALADGPVRVRIGIHTGEPVVADEGYVGVDVHRAARIMGAGHGGQVLVSEATVGLVDAVAEFQDLGEHRLKDLSAPQRLYQLGHGAFPPLRTLHRTNLPIQSTPLVGRENELWEAGGLLRSHRLLTLTGTGGTGKTRLALQLAAEAVEQFPDGMFWVPLQAVSEPALVGRAIEASLSTDEGVIAQIGNKQLLILLDNFEQVIDAAPTVSSIVAATPNAKLLVTSREPLRVDSEQRYPVEPLPERHATALFVERARAVAPGFERTPKVGQICQRLDGLPLAIELAAARVALLDPGELLARLDRRLPLLTARSRDAPARQRTLRATIEWSHDLLASNEQDLFARLAVFSGSYSLEAAETVCDGDLDTLESLVEKSLVRRWGGSSRLGMLDTIREFAIEKLGEMEERDDIRRRHAEFFLALAESANLNPRTFDPRKPVRHEIAATEEREVVSALAWALETESVDVGLRLATAMGGWLWGNSEPREGLRWFEVMLANPAAESVAPEILAEALCEYGAMADLAGENERATALYERSFALFERLGDDSGRAALLHRLGNQAMRRGQLGRAQDLTQRSHAIHEQSENKWGVAQTLGTLGAIARDEGDDDAAHELIAQSASITREIGDAGFVAWWTAGMLVELAAISLRARRLDEAETYAKESLALAEDLRDRAGRVFALGILACIAAERGRLADAGRLWGAIEDEDTGAPLGGWRRQRPACEARLRHFLGPELERGLTKGRKLTLDDAVSIALA
jgi:predicted ATPase/class 3 adenylate cyclase